MNRKIWKLHLISISFDALHKKLTSMFLWLFTDNIYYVCPIIVIMFVYFSFWLLAALIKGYVHMFEQHLYIDTFKLECSNLKNIYSH